MNTAMKIIGLLIAAFAGIWIGIEWIGVPTSLHEYVFYAICAVVSAASAGIVYHLIRKY